MSREARAPLTPSRLWPAGALVVLLALPPSAGAQALKTARVAGGSMTAGGRTLPVSGGYVDPRTGEGRVEVLRRPLVLRRRDVRSVSTRGLVTRVRTRDGARLRLRLAQMLFVGGTTEVRVDPGLGLTARGGTFTITDGRLDARTLAGTLGHTGTLTLSRGDKSIDVYDVGLAVPALTAQLWDFRAPVATLRDVERDLSGLRVEIRASALLGAVAARELEETFETPFRVGAPFLTVTVRGRLRG